MRSVRRVFFVAAVCICLPVRGDVREAVVRIGGCSGVCIDPSGLVLSAKHCDHSEQVTIEFSGRTVQARRVYVAPESEGPVVFDCEGEGFPFAEVAGSVPAAGDHVWSLGCPRTPEGRGLRRNAGRLLRGGTFEFRGGTFRGNVVSFATGAGWSGGPLFNDQGQVIGLLSSSDCLTSVFISYSAVRRACDAVRKAPQRKRELLVFVSETCPPCRAFKADYEHDAGFRTALDAAFELQWIDVDRHPQVARQHGVTDVPSFVPADGPVIVGYESKDRLLERLGVNAAPKELAAEQVVPEEVPAANAPPQGTVAAEPAHEAAPPQSPTVDDGSRGGEMPVSDLEARLNRVMGVARAAMNVATWLGITGATGGAGGLILGAIALVTAIRGRRRSSAARAPPAIVPVDTPPPPQAIVPETRFAPYERDTFAEAFAWAETEMVRKYPGAVSTLEKLKGLMDQFLSARGIKRTNRGSENVRK